MIELIKIIIIIVISADLTALPANLISHSGLVLQADYTTAK